MKPVDMTQVPQPIRDQIGMPVEFRSDTIAISIERLTDQKFRFQTIGSIANVINGNNRIIPMSVQQDAVTEWKRDKWQLTSYEEHPPEENINGSMKELAGTCDVLELNEAGETIVNIRLLPTKEGEHVKLLFDSEVQVGVSQRALGIQSVREDANGRYFIVVDKIVKILGYDFCLLDQAAAGERTQIRLLDTIEVDRIVNLKRIEDTFNKENGDMLKPEELQAIVDTNAQLVESVTALVDAIQAQMKQTEDGLPQEILDTFQTLRTAVEKVKTDDKMDPEKKNSALSEIATSLKAIVDTIVPPSSASTETPETILAAETTSALATEQTLSVLTDSATRLREAVERQAREKAANEHASRMATYLTDKVNALPVPDDAKTVVLDTLKARSYGNESLIDAAVDSMSRMLNLGAAQERMKQEGLTSKGITDMQITIVPDHLKGVAVIADQILGTGYVQGTKENILTGKERKPTLRQFLKIYDTIHGASLAAEAAKIVALQDASTTPADFQIPYTISRIVLEEVYSDYLIESLTDYGPMENKRDSVPITVYRREGGLETTRKTYKPSKARISELKTGEFGKMAKGKLTTAWHDIDATATKLQASFSDEFATLSKRHSNITGVSRGIANLIADLKRSLQQMVFNNMRNSALAYNSTAFSFSGVGNGVLTSFTVSSGASISLGEALSVKVDGVDINEYEVSSTGSMFYVVDGPNGKILFVDESGDPKAPVDTKTVVVTGKKSTNEVRFSLGAGGAVAWEKYMNQLLFKVQNQVASHRQTRGYKPDFILTSEVTSNYLTQAEAYTPLAARAGFDAGSVKGEGNYGRTANLPHFGSDVWDDAYILISQRDATIFRIFEPLSLKGPYPVRDGDGSLLGGDEYYIYQEDALKTPLLEKMSLVTVVA